MKLPLSWTKERTLDSFFTDSMALCVSDITLKCLPYQTLKVHDVLTMLALYSVSQTFYGCCPFASRITLLALKKCFRSVGFHVTCHSLFLATSLSPPPPRFPQLPLEWGGGAEMRWEVGITSSENPWCGYCRIKAIF